MFRFAALLALLPALVLAVPADELQFAQIAAYKAGAAGQQNCSGQFGITLSRSEFGSRVKSPLVCASPVYDVCYNFSNPLLVQQPINVLSETFMNINFKYKYGAAPLRTYKDMKPKAIQARLCFSNESANDRGWRKKNKPYPRLTENCLFTTEPKDISTINLATDDIEFRYNMIEGEMAELMPTGTMFVMLWVTCEDDTVCAFDTTENKNFIQVQVYQTVTTEMTVAAIILSISSIVIFFGFYAFDTYWYKKTGHGFYF